MHATAGGMLSATWLCGWWCSEIAGVREGAGRCLLFGGERPGALYVRREGDRRPSVSHESISIDVKIADVTPTGKGNVHSGTAALVAEYAASAGWPLRERSRRPVHTTDPHPLQPPRGGEGAATLPSLNCAELPYVSEQKRI